jgi:hypothetical protein
MRYSLAAVATNEEELSKVQSQISRVSGYIYVVRSRQPYATGLLNSVVLVCMTFALRWELRL